MKKSNKRNKTTLHVFNGTCVATQNVSLAALNIKKKIMRLLDAPM